MLPGFIRKAVRLTGRHLDSVDCYQATCRTLGTWSFNDL